MAQSEECLAGGHEDMRLEPMLVAHICTPSVWTTSGLCRYESLGRMGCKDEPDDELQFQ